MLARFLRDRRGSIAPLLGFAAIPLIGGVGVAVDYSRATATKTAFQAALNSTALMLSKNAANLSAADLQTPATPILQRPVHPRPRRRTSPTTTSYSSTGGSKVVLSGSATLPTNFLGVLGYDQLNITANSDRHLGQHPAARRAGARQHRLDGERRQDDGAEDRGARPADAAAGGGDHARRRLCLDHPVQQGREYRRRQLRRVVAALGPVGGRQRQLQHQQIRQFANQVHQQRRHLDAGGPLDLERLPHRPRPELRHHQRRAARRRDAVPGRAVFVLPRLDDGPVERLDRAVHARSTP